MKRKISNGKLTKEEKVLRRQILQVRLYPGEKQELRDMCKRTSLDMSDTVRALIRAACECTHDGKLRCIHGQPCKFGLSLQEALPLFKAALVDPGPGGGVYHG